MFLNLNFLIWLLTWEIIVCFCCWFLLWVVVPDEVYYIELVCETTSEEVDDDEFD